MSDWSKVTRPIPVPSDLTRPFWAAAKRGVRALQRCQACGHFQHPPYPTCVSCMAIDLAFEPVSGKGAIYAYTIMYHAGDRRFAAAIPYASIIVELDGAPGALLAGNLLEAPYTEAKVGRRVEVIFEPLNDDITLPQFRLSGETSYPQGAKTHVGAAVQGRPQRRRILQGHPVRRDPPRRPRAASGEGRRRGLRADHGRHRRPGHLPRAAGHRPRGD